MADRELYPWEKKMIEDLKQKDFKWFERPIYVDEKADKQELANVEKRLNQCVKGALKYDFNELLYVTDPEEFYISTHTRNSYASNYPNAKVLPYYCNLQEVWVGKGRYVGSEWNTRAHRQQGIVTDMAKFLALKGSVLFDIIDKAYDPKITKNNYSLTKEEIIELQKLLLNSLDLQKEYIESKLKNGKITSKEYEDYMREYNESKEKVTLIDKIWDKKVNEISSVKKVVDAENDVKAKQNELKETKRKMYALKQEERLRRKEEKRLERERIRKEKEERYNEEAGSDIAD